MRSPTSPGNHDAPAEAAFLDDATTLFNSTLDLAAVLQKVAQLATQVLGDSCTIFLIEEGTEALTAAATYTVDPEQARARSRFLRENPLRIGGPSATGQAAATGKPVLIRDAQTDPGINRAHVEPLKLHSYIAAPMICKGRLLGVLGTSITTPDRQFTERDLALAMAVAERAALAIDNARLFALEQQRREQLEILMAISAALGTSLKLEDLLQSVGPQILKHLRFERLGITLLDEDGQHWRRALMLFPSAELREGTRAPIAGTRSGWAITHRQPMVVSDLATQASPPFVLDDWLLKNGVRSSIYTPLCFGDEVFGTLNVHSSAPGVATPAHVPLLQEIGHRLAMAIHQARLYGTLERAYRELRATEEDIRQLNEALEQRVLQRTAELEAANQELEAFSYSVSHDLRAPLRAIDGFARILLEEEAPHLSDEARRYLHLVRDNAQHMGQLIDNLLRFARLNRQPLQKQPVAPAELVRQALEDLASYRDGRCVDIVIGDLPACQADPALLKQVFVNLLANALKFTRRQEVARIEIGSQRLNGERVYFVKDNGVGFDMQYLHKLFGVFQRLHRAEDYEGTGVGLAIVQRIIHRHGGRVWPEAAVNQGATFYLTLGEGPSHA